MTTTLYTEAQAAERLQIKPDTLRAWRTRGGGPKYSKIGRLVRYSDAAITAFIASRECASTSEKAA
jgi:predicted DNA-binding transcriptional regulator AlpA